MGKDFGLKSFGVGVLHSSAFRESGRSSLSINSPATRPDSSRDIIPCEGLSEVGASFEQMSTKAVTQSMGVDVLVLETGALRRVAGI
jgi:hypothetical protein